jgi:L-fuconate dehydratase
LSTLGYPDEKIAQLTKESVQAGFKHFKMKVGIDLKDDLRRGKLIRSIIDDPQWQPPSDDPELASAGGARHLPSVDDDPALAGKNAGPTGAVLMVDANQVWDVQQAIDYMTSLAEIRPWCVCNKSLSFSLHSVLDAEGEARGLFWGMKLMKVY